MKFMRTLVAAILTVLLLCVGIFDALGESPKIVWPSNVKVIPKEAFRDAGFKGQVIIEEGVQRIESLAFDGCRPSYVQFPDSLTYIADDAFGEVGRVSVSENTEGYAWAVRHGYANSDPVYVGTTELQIVKRGALNLPFRAPEAGLYTFVVDSDLWMECYLFDADLSMINYDNNGDMVISAVLEKDENILIRVTCLDDTLAGSFTLKIIRSDLGHVLALGENNVALTDEVTTCEFTAPEAGVYSFDIGDCDMNAVLRASEDDPDKTEFTESAVITMAQGDKVYLDLEQRDNASVAVLVAREQAAGEGTVYRALIIGQTYPDTTLELLGCAVDARSISMTAGAMNTTPYSITQRTNLTAQEIISAIGTAFSGADDDDVSLFYYSGHGAEGTGALVGVDRKSVAIATLKAALDEIPGSKIVVLDSCYSGQFIPKSTKSVAEVSNDAIINVFASSMRSRSDSASGAYYVLTAAAADELSWGDNIGGVFTQAFVRGSGYSSAAGNYTPDGSMPADADSSRGITISEAYSYSKKHMILDEDTSQNVQCYPSGSEFVIWGKQ